MKGMGRTLGWIVATEEGELRFRDCQGRLTTVRDGRVESTTRRCERIGDGVEVVGAVRALDPVARILLTEDSSGRVHGFYLEDAIFDAPSLLDVKPGQSVRVTGPVAGRATRIERR